MSNRFERGIMRMLGIKDTDDVQEQFFAKQQASIERRRSFDRTGQKSNITIQVRDRLSHIRRRNKRRRILVVMTGHQQGQRNYLVDAALGSNPKATPDFMNFPEALEALTESPSRWDMIYLVSDLGQSMHGHCLFSVDHEADAEAREARAGDTKTPMDLINSLRGEGTELIMVCGTIEANCPISDELRQIKHGIIENEQIEV